MPVLVGVKTPTVSYTGRWLVQGVYADIILDPRLSALAKATYVVLLGFISAPQNLYPATEDLGFVLNLTPQEVEKSVAELKQHGLLSEESGDCTIHNHFPKQPKEELEEEALPVLFEAEEAREDYPAFSAL